jgi:REP element-mobilizing transposase RayT
MTRKLRRPEEGAIYHLIAKGNQGDFIFDERKNKIYFIECLKKAVEDYQALIYAYCIMGNHYHVVLQNTKANLSEIMHYVGSSFASYLRKQGRIGHIFSGRYKSIHLEGRERLLYLSKYVHLNPVRASIVKNPEDYDWSSYRFFAWDLEPPDWLYLDWVRGHFKPDNRRSHARYREFVESGLFLPSRGPENLMTARGIVEGERFLQDIKGSGGEGRPSDDKRLDALHYEVCRYYKVDDLHLQGSKHSPHALRSPRRVFAYIAMEFTFASQEEIARRLGNKNPSRVAQLYRDFVKGTEKDREDNELQEDVAMIVSRFWAPFGGI